MTSICGMRDSIQFLKSLKWAAWAFVFLAFVALSLLDEQLTGQLEGVIHAERGSNTLALIAFGLASVGLSLVFPAIANASIFRFRILHADQDFLQILKYTLIETMRAWGQVFARILLFVLPGLWRIVELVYVPIIVGFSRAYQQGHLDALQTSAKIMRKFWWQTLLVIGVFNLLVPFVISSQLSEYRSFQDSPISAIAIAFVEALSFILGTAVLVGIAAQVEFLQAQPSVTHSQKGNV